MNKHLQRKHRLSKSENEHLLNIFDERYFLKVGVINLSSFKKLLSEKIVKLSDLIHLEYYQDPSFFSKIMYLYNLAKKDKTIQLYLSYGLLVWPNEQHAQQFSPICLVPIHLYFLNDQIYVQRTSGVIENLILIENLIKLDKSFYPLNEKLHNIYSLDRYILSFKKNHEFKVHLDSFITFGYLEQQQLFLNHQKFHIDKNITNQISEKHYLQSEEYGINLFPLNSIQKNILAQAVAGYSFGIDGILGTGKTTTLVNVAVDTLYRGKRVLYVSNIDNTLEKIEDLVKEFRINHFVCNLTKNSLSFSVGEINYLEKENFVSKEVVTNLAKNYQFIEELERAVFSRIRNNRVLDTLTYLASLKENYQLLNIPWANNLYKHEYLEIYNSLVKIEKNLLRFPNFKQSIWQNIPYAHTIKYPNQVITLIYKMHKYYRNLENLCQELITTFGFKEFNSYIKMRKLINIFDAFKNTKYPSNWIDNNFANFFLAQEYFPTFKKQYDEYYTTYNDIKYLYSLETITVNFDEVIQNLCGTYFTKDNLENINRIIDNRLNLLIQVHRSNEIIDNFSNIISELQKTLKYDFALDEKVFDDLNNLYLYIANNAYHPNWIKINTLHKLYRTIDEVKQIITKITKYEQYVQEFLHKYPKVNINLIDLNNDLTILIKRQKNKSLSLKEKVIIHKYHNHPIEEAIHDVKTIVDLANQHEILLQRYLELTSFSYSKDFNIIDSLENLYNLQKNLSHPEHLEIFKKYLQTRTQKTNLIYGQANPLKEFSEAYSFINKYRTNLRQCGFVIEEDFVKSLSQIKEINKYLNNFYSTYDEFIISTNLIDKKIYFEDIVKLQNLTSKLIELKNDFYNNSHYSTYFGMLYDYERTNILKLQTSLKNFQNYLNCFINLDYANKFFEENYHNKLIEYLNLILKNIEEIDELIKLYTKLFVDRISTYYYNDFKDVITYLEKFLSSKDELVLYLNITNEIKVLLEYRANDLIEYITDINQNSNLSENFKYTYNYYLYQEFCNKYPYVLNTNALNQILDETVTYERQLLNLNTNQVSHKIINDYDIPKLSLKKDSLSFTDFIQKAQNDYRLVLCDTKILDQYLDIRKFDLVIIDDAHISHANAYKYALSGKQVIVAGNSEHSSLVKMNLISQIPKESVITLTHRYLPIPKNIFDLRHNLTGLIPNDYFANQGVEISNTNIEQFIREKLLENINYKFNVFVYEQARQMQIFDNLIKIFKENHYSKSQIIDLLTKNINIVNLEQRLIIDADYNLVIVDEYRDDFELSNVNRMISDLFTVKEKVIIFDANNLLGQKVSNRFLSKLQLQLNELEITYNEHLLQINLMEKLKEQFARYDISLIGSYHDLNLVLLADNQLYGCIIYWDNNKINYQTLEQYRTIYQQYRKYQWKIYLIWIVDLVRDFNKTVERIAKEIGRE
ncbi:MAG TPA: hypothetical protein PK924_04875 [Bacilli bacterium]|nr:hypothetical protein [Bacilli bacterium]